MLTNHAIVSQIYTEVSRLIEDPSQEVSGDTPLLGGDSLLDSMKLVELCLTLEDKASEWGFEFDWTSDAAMSKSRSMFKTAGSLVNEFIDQMKRK